MLMMGQGMYDFILVMFPDSKGSLPFDFPKIKDKDHRPRGNYVT